MRWLLDHPSTKEQPYFLSLQEQLAKLQEIIARLVKHTDRQRLFLFGKLSGLNDKDAALAAGYSLSVAEKREVR